MQSLQVRSARSDLPMSNADRKQFGIMPDKHKKLPTHDLHEGQNAMYHNSVTKQWHPTIITSLCQEKRSYKIRTSDGVCYQKT